MEWHSLYANPYAFLSGSACGLKVGVYIPIHLVSDVSHDVGIQVIT